ncbi:MAG: Slp family lipoprotein [Nitrospirae bacterium]|nr:Slp family lipoprotein [Nitrospirota bacterium]
MNIKRVLLLVAVGFLISSCTHVLSKSVREQSRTDILFSEIKGNIDKYKGSIFILGGIIVETKNTEEGSIIEAVQTPVNEYGDLIDTDLSSGRFMAIDKGYLDPMIHKKRREITIAGELIGSRKKKIGDTEYTYPLFAIKELHLWKEEKGRYYYYYHPPYPYYPHWYWYRYPYWW